ncbi:MAG: carbohydrate binding family 9 domain-containing protein [Acidobacteriota bacterium]|nr:MAG: carbohydrate binding family 9 domain-containing protein [Acidobacteriota bacterium]
MRFLAVIAFVSFLCAAAAAQNGGGPSASPLPQPVESNGSGISPRPDEASQPVGKVMVPAHKMRPVTIPKAFVPPTIDGRIDEEIWQQAAVFDDFYQVAPGDNIAPSKPTIVYMLYDEKHIYLAFKCFDDRDKIRATVAKRDNVFGEDNVRVWLDTFNDQRRAYVLGFNPLGIQQDGIFTEGQGADFSVDIVMESRGVLEDWGWSVEVKIPFKSLRYRAGKGVMWGFNVARNIDRLNDELNQWLPDDRNVAGFLIKHGKITGLDDVKYERTLEVVPSVTLSQTGRRTRTIPRNQLLPGVIDQGRFVNQPIKHDIGVTLKYTISPSVTLDAAINPDFAEIEADAPVVTANQRFPIFFEEKRPFFLEGADIFRSPLQVFYSRNIVDPDAAVKLTGKKGKTSFGILAASDKAPGNYSDEDRNDPQVLPRISEFVDKNSMFAVLRLKRDIGKENNIGFFGTYRNFVEQKNLTAGFDGRMKLSPKITSSFQVVGTNSKRCFLEREFDPAADPVQAQRNREICGTGSTGSNPLSNGTYNRYRVGNGIGYYANLDYTTDRSGWFFEAGGRSGKYRTDSGFTRQTDTNFLFLFNRWSTESKPTAKIIRANWQRFVSFDYDWKGRTQGANLGTSLGLSLQRSTYLNFNFNQTYQKIYEEEFGLKRTSTRPQGTFLGEPTRSTWVQTLSANINQAYNKKFNYGAFVGMRRNVFDYFYFDPATGLQDPGPALQTDAEVWGEVKPVDPLRISASYRKSRMNRKETGERRFDSDIFSLRSTYQFTRFLFTRFRLDYDSMRRNFAGQVLFGWAPNPGTAIYAGYNDSINYNGFNPFTGQYEPGLKRDSRTFFVRASYLFRKSF